MGLDHAKHQYLSSENIMSLIVTFVLISLPVSLHCSLCETAFYAITPEKVETLRLAGSSSDLRSKEAGAPT